MDGNVIRVFSRLLDLDADVRLPATQNQLWQVAEDWTDRTSPEYEKAQFWAGIARASNAADRDDCTPTCAGRMAAVGSVGVAAFPQAIASDAARMIRTD